MPLSAEIISAIAIMDRRSGSENQYPNLEAPAPSTVGFHFRPRTGNCLVLPADRVLRLDRAEQAGLAIFGPTTWASNALAFGLGIQLHDDGQRSPWVHVDYSWHEDAAKSPVATIQDGRELHPEERVLAVVSVDAYGQFVARRQAILPADFAMKLHKRVEASSRATRGPAQWVKRQFEVLERAAQSLDLVADQVIVDLLPIQAAS